MIFQTRSRQGMIAIFRRDKIRHTEIEDDNYPQRLLSIAGAPKHLYYRGDISLISQSCSIAVIGSRRVSEQGMKIAYKTGYELGRRGIHVVNGLALGCDTHALRGALAAGGKCTAVMPCGLEQIVPYPNMGLAEKIVLGGGCLVSEYPPSTPAQRYQYVERDRLQSGLSDGVIVIEAAYDSGTIHTVRYAIKQGRKLACIDSRLVRYSSGNQWIEGKSGVCVIRTAENLDSFMSDILCEIVYRQITLEAMEV